MSNYLTFLPKKIVLKDGTELVPYIGALTNDSVVALCNMNRGAKYRRIKVLASRLRGRLDAFGIPYQPTEWVFTNLKQILK